MKDISENEIQILGLNYEKPDKKRLANKKRLKRLLLVALLAAIAAVTVTALILLGTRGYDEAVSVQLEIQPKAEESAANGYIEVREETVNDVPLMIYIPRNALPELTLTLPEENDTTVVFVAHAADVGGNDYGIVGDFVLNGERLARGVRKVGFCAIIDRKITIGINTDTPLLEEAIHREGSFFRQYPLVKNSQAIDNKPKGKAIRRALAIRDGEILMIECCERESFHDFIQALADAGVSEAISLVGSTAYGWYRNEQGIQTFFGVKKEELLKGLNYLVWRR